MGDLRQLQGNLLQGLLPQSGALSYAKSPYMLDTYSGMVQVDRDWEVHLVSGRLIQHRVLSRSCQEAGAEEQSVEQEEEGRGEGAEVPPHHCELLQPP